MTDTLLARQAVLQQEYEIAAARRDLRVAEGKLASAVGLSPLAMPQIAAANADALPKALPATVDAMIQQMLGNRPDLAAKFAQIRAREAYRRRARADYLPSLSAGAMAGQ